MRPVVRGLKRDLQTFLKAAEGIATVDRSSFMERGARTMTTFQAQLNHDHEHTHPLQFPRELARSMTRLSSRGRRQVTEHADRRMRHLARTLGCLGYFEPDGNGPRAA